MSNWEDSILSIRDKYTSWRLDFTKYLKITTRYYRYRFFWEMIPMIYFIQNNKGIAWTDSNHNIFLNIPHDKVKLEKEKWEFIYYHECLHQLFDTFSVGETLQKKEGNNFSHELLNIASDCIINNYVKKNCNLEYPTDFLITPEYIKDTYGIEYNPREDNQYGLYMKLKKVQKEILDDPLVQQTRENMPDVDIDMEGDGGGVKTVKLPTSDEWKQGSKEARRIANDILSKYNDLAKRQPNGKLSKEEAITMMQKASEEIKKLVGNPVRPNQAKEWVDFHVMDSSEFILENETKTIDKKYTTYEQGWDYAIDDVLKQIEQTIEQYSQSGGANAGGKQGTTGVQSVPENDPTEERPFLPQPNMKGGSSGSSSDQNDDKQQDNQNNSQVSNEQIDNMSGQEAADIAQTAADEARDAANEAQQKADAAEQKADAAQNGSESSSSESSNSNLQKMAKESKNAANAAQKAAKEAQDAANKSKEAASNGDDDTAKSEAKKAQSAANEAKKQSQNADIGSSQQNTGTIGDGTNDLSNQKTGDPEEARGLDDDGIDWDKAARDSNNSNDSKQKGWGDQVSEIRTFASKNKFGDMTAEDVKQAIKRYASGLDQTLSDFVKKCKDSKDLKSGGIIVQTQMQQRNSSWAEKFSDIIKNTVRQKVVKKSSEWNKTYNRPNRRQGVTKNNDILLKGKMRKKDKLTISLAYYVDVSGSMNASSIQNIFKYIYSMADAIESKYKGNAVVEECIFKTFAFNSEYKEIKRPNIPIPGGGTEPLINIVRKMKSFSQSYMINVILTDGEMDYDIPGIKRELEDFAGNIVFITNDHNIARVLSPLTKMEGGDCGNKFELINVDSDFKISDNDFRQI